MGRHVQETQQGDLLPQDVIDLELTGYTNLLIKDKEGCPYPGVGRGLSVEDTLKDTIRNFLEMLNEKESWHEDDFEIADPYNF